MLDAEYPKLTTQYEIPKVRLWRSKSGPFPIVKQLTHPAKLVNHNLINMQNKPNLCGFSAEKGDFEAKQTQLKTKQMLLY
ncbi:MAG: hypothetical protein DRP62_03565, partial [Planctomycetota bacterium]